MTIFDYIEIYAKKRPDIEAFCNGAESITYGGLYNILLKMQQMENRYRNKIILLKNETAIEFVLAFLYLLSENCMVIPISNVLKESELMELVLDIDYLNFDYSIIKKIMHSKQEEQCNILRKPSKTNAGIYHATSGSTGKPKLCIRTLENLTKEGLAYKECLKINPYDKIFSLCPLHHSYALGVALMGALVSGASLYIADKFSPRKSIRTILEKEMTILILVPAIAKLMCEVKREERTPLQSIRIALTGAGIIDIDLFNKFYHEFGIYLHSNYGSTETGGLLTRLDKKIFPSLGQAMKGVQTKICPENSDDSYGELYVKAEGMLQGYVNQEESVFDAEGFYAMGDYVSKDIDGNLYYRGRKKRIINIGGKKIDPEEVETVIGNFPGVKECIVMESERRNHNNIVVAFIIADQEESKDLYQHCINHLSQYKVPSMFHFIKKIPRNEVGKIKFNDLRELAQYL